MKLKIIKSETEFEPFQIEVTRTVDIETIEQLNQLKKIKSNQFNSCSNVTCVHCVLHPLGCNSPFKKEFFDQLDVDKL